MISSAPVGGSWSRWHRLASPNLPAPCSRLCAGNGGSKAKAWPASVPTASTPQPRMSRCSTRNRMQATLGPGTCGPVSLALRNAAGSSRRDQSVRISTQVPAGIRPCAASHASMLRGLEQEVGVGRDLLRAVDHAGRCDQQLRRDRVGMGVRQLAAGDPVRRRVEVRAGMLAAADVVPVPGRARARRSARSPRSGTAATVPAAAAAGSPASTGAASGSGRRRGCRRRPAPRRGRRGAA